MARSEEAARAEGDGDVEALRKQLAVEQDLREAADTENARLQAQVEAYAEDLATLYQERHGRGRGGLATEVADLRAELADEAAQREFLTELHKRSAHEARQLSDQLVAYGKDLAQAYRRGQRAAKAGSWWRRPAALLPLASGAAGLLLGAAGYATLAPPATPVPTVAADALYGPPAPASATTTSVLVASRGELLPLGTARATPDFAASAATAAAVALTGATVGPSGSDSARAASTAASAAATAAADQAAGAVSANPTPRDDARAGTPLPDAATPPAASTPDLRATITSFAATGTALAATAQAARLAATPAPSVAVPTPTPTTAIEELAPAGELKRCRFEVIVPPLGPGAGYAIRFAQQSPADVVVLWSQTDGEVRLYQETPGETGLGTLVAQGAAAGDARLRDVVAHGMPNGAYRAQLWNLAADAAGETRVALFYDDKASCRPEPTGASIDAAAGTQPAVPVATDTAAAPGSTLAPPSPTLPPSSSTPPLPSATPPPPSSTPPLPSATPPPPSPAPSTAPVAAALAPTSATVATSTPQPQPTSPPAPTPTPVRPYVDCRPYLRGPSGYIEVKPIVWVDTAHSVYGSWPVRAFLTGPGGLTSVAFTATPDRASRDLPLSGYGSYRFWVEADGADLDPDCTWNFDHDRYV